AGNDDDEVRKLTGSWSLSLNSNDKLAFWVTVRVCGGPGASSWQARGTTTRHRPGQYKREPGQGSLASSGRCGEQASAHSRTGRRGGIARPQGRAGTAP